MKQGVINYIYKFTHNVFKPNNRRIKAFTSIPFLLPRAIPLNTGTTKQIGYTPWGQIEVLNLAMKSCENYGIPTRYDSCTYTLNILTLTQISQQATSYPKMERLASTSLRQMAIFHPAVTTRQLLPRDSALINPEIKELDRSHHPAHIAFLVLAREITPSELLEGTLDLPICHAIWDFLDPDTFYNVLHQVIDLLEPAHRRPGALITTASASEALGTCII